MIYNVKIYNDMGHLSISNTNNTATPEHIKRFLYQKIKNKINYATNLEDHGCTYYILKPGLQKQWTYTFNNDVITLTYDLDDFNPKIHIYMS
jgi:hypothetical protein